MTRSILPTSLAIFIVLVYCFAADACYVEKRQHIIDQLFPEDVRNMKQLKKDAMGGAGAAFEDSNPDVLISLAVYNNPGSPVDGRSIVRTTVPGKSLVLLKIQLFNLQWIHVVAAANEKACDLTGIPQPEWLNHAYYSTRA